MAEKVYPSVDSMALGQHYIRHVDAMTREGLHSKADIAAQLGWRDQELERLREELAKAHSLIGTLAEPDFTVARQAMEIANAHQALLTPRPLAEWPEEIGDVLWWVLPFEPTKGEPPYCGTPLDAGWPGYHTHWTPLPKVWEHRP